MKKVEFIPAPRETAGQFAVRCAAAQQAHTLVQGPLVESAARKPALDRIERTYGVRPEGVPVYASRQGLRPWQGGMSWILELEKPPTTVATIQVRDSCLGYSREELLSHEYAHAARVAYNEPRYEEYFAYHLSQSRFRRIFGPAFESQNDAYAVLISWLVGALGSFFSLWFWVPALMLLVYGLGRLVVRHRKLNRCVEKIKEIFPANNAWAVAFRLTDREVDLFASWQAVDIRAYISRSVKKSLRWSAIQASLGGVTKV